MEKKKHLCLAHSCLAQTGKMSYLVFPLSRLSIRCMALCTIFVSVLFFVFFLSKISAFLCRSIQSIVDCNFDFQTDFRS